MNSQKWLAAILTGMLIFVVTLFHDEVNWQHAFIIGGLLIITIIKEQEGTNQ